MRYLLFIALAAAALSVCSGKAQAQPTAAEEYDIKAAFIYNFAKFIEWPDGTFSTPGSPVVLCVFGRGAIEKSFGEVHGKTVKGRNVDVIFNDDIDNIKSCNIIFLSTSDKKYAGAVLDSVKGVSVVTVGETPDFIHSGGIISFKSQGNKIRFEINPIAAKRARLTISSQLLKLADISRGR